jgi:hypothetical protein
MKIRITGKGLPKAQLAGQQKSNVPTTLSYNGELISPNDPRYAQLMSQSSLFLNSGRQKLGLQNGNKIDALKAAGPKFPSLTFKPFGQAPVQPSGSSSIVTPTVQPTNTTAAPAANTTSTTPKRFWHSEWDDEEFDTDPASPFYQAPQAAAANTQSNTSTNPVSWYSKNIGQPVEKAFQDINRLTSWGNFGTELVNSYKRKQEFDKRLRRQTSTDSLFPEVPSEMSGNRGDYVVSGSRFGEFRPDEYVVNKGMYTGQFLPRMAQYGGGIIPDELMLPVDQIPFSMPLQSPMATGEAYATSENASPAPVKSSGANPVAEQTWKEVSSQFQGVQNWGIWGDANHKKSVSDHNTGDALDIGITGLDQGNEIAQKLIKEAQDKNIKYIIWNKQIWNPSVSNSWRPYNGKSPHTDHVHVSFNRASGGNVDGEIALSHNNPLNIHHGDFTSKYGGVQGAKDSGGFVSKFPDFQTGIRAAQDLLFGPAYSNLTISQARNKWVSGSPDKTNASTPDIVKAMGTDKVLADLTPEERDKLIKQFARWEGKQAYNKLSGMKLYADGGTISQYESGGIYELTEDEIKSILASGGEVEFL